MKSELGLQNWLSVEIEGALRENEGRTEVEFFSFKKWDRRKEASEEHRTHKEHMEQTEKIFYFRTFQNFSVNWIKGGEFLG